MQIEQIRQLNSRQGFTKQKQNSNQNPNFTGVPDLALRFLDTNQAWGACAVDLGCMVLPRTITDFGRGTDAGMETARREGTGTVNHSLVGVYGTVAGLALATGINHAFKLGDNDIKASSIFADSETLDLCGKVYGQQVKKSAENPIKSFLVETLKNFEVLNPNENGKWVTLKDEDIEKTANILESEIKNSGNKISKDGFNNAKNTIISSIGAENNFRIIAHTGDAPHTSRYTADYLVENLYKLGKVFNKDTVTETFKEAADITSNKFLKLMKSMNVKRSLAGIGVASAVGVAAQPVNMYLTKKKTGKSGFVGGGGEDNSTGFKIKKALFAALFGTGVLATIGKPKDLIKNLQFKGFTPTIKQFKFIYGVTIMSRFLSARNDNELTESTIKDTLGFANWLILGNFVQKLVAQSMDKSLIKKDGNGFIKWITGSVLKTRDEVLHSALGKKAFKDGKALKYSEMVKLADKPTLKKLRILSIAQIIGYAYSGLVLGVGIPKLNIFLTNRREAKKAAGTQPTQTSTSQNPEQTNAKFMQTQMKTFFAK